MEIYWNVDFNDMFLLDFFYLILDKIARWLKTFYHFDYNHRLDNTDNDQSFEQANLNSNIYKFLIKNSKFKKSQIAGIGSIMTLLVTIYLRENNKKFWEIKGRDEIFQIQKRKKKEGRRRGFIVAEIKINFI